MKWFTVGLVLVSFVVSTNVAVGAPKTQNNTENKKIDFSFTCKHEVFPEPSEDTEVLFRYARWLKKNRLDDDDEQIKRQIEIGRLYRIAAENGHFKAMANLLSGGINNEFKVYADERVYFANTLISNNIASGYYFMGIFLERGNASIETNQREALMYFRKAADEGHPASQQNIADMLAPINIAPDVARQMRRCAAEQGMGDAAVYLGIGFKLNKRYQEAIEVWQLGVAGGNEGSASRLHFAYSLAEESMGNDISVYGQKLDPERARRYKVIKDYLTEYEFDNPKVPEINEIVPLPPAELPPWDGKLQWVEAHFANVEPRKPSEALIKRLAQNKQLNPTTGRPTPESPNFESTHFETILSKTGESCPKTGYWELAWLPREGTNLGKSIQVFKEGQIMPTNPIEFFKARPWPLKDKRIRKDQPVEWRFVTFL